MKEKDKSHKKGKGSHNRHAEESRRPGMSVKLGRWLAPASMAVLFLVAWLMLWLVIPHVLRRCEALSLFLPTSMFFSQCMAAPGGIVDWLATFLTQYLYHPWLGALIYAVLLVALQWLIGKAFNISHNASTAVVPAMLLLDVASLGYEIYSIRMPGVFFSPLVGTLFVAVLCWAGRLASARPILGAVFTALCPLLYPLIGTYAFIAAILCILLNVKSKLPAIVAALIAVALILYVPVWWVTHITTTISFSNMYLAALPRLLANEWALWLPYAIAAAYLVVAATGLVDKLKPVVGAAIATVAIISAPVLRNTDANFHATVKMQLALDDQDYNAAFTIAQELQQEPTRVNVLLREAALNHLGIAGDYMFTFPNGAADYNTKRGPRTFFDVGAYIPSYHMGRINYAYRWAMEYMVEYGPRIDYLKYMVKCALLNNEKELAKKHLDVLLQTRNHRDWARKYYPYLNNRQAIVDDPEMNYIDKLAHFDEFIVLGNGMFERYLRRTLADDPVRTTEALDLALQNCLHNKQVTLFAQRLPRYASKVKRLPRHYQEALLLADQITHSDISAPYTIDQQVKKQFADFATHHEQYKNLPKDEQRRLMEPMFGRTYWFYFVYVNDLNTI